MYYSTNIVLFLIITYNRETNFSYLLNMDKYKKLTREFIAFKSISTDAQYKDEMRSTAQWLKMLFEKYNFNVELAEGYGNPIVIAHYEADPSFETCLVYGHYDVQPADVADGWDSDPFELTERDGRLFARGAIDNKGQVMVHISNILDLIEEDLLKYNIKFMIEGNEETGSPDMERFMHDYTDKLKADFTMISDGEQSGDNPTMSVSFRGGFNSTLIIKSSTTDLHSGLFGSAVPSSSTVMSQALAGLWDNQGRVTIDGFYDDVLEIDNSELEKNSKREFDLKVSGTKQLLTEPGYDFYTQVGLRPAVIITGIQSGYTGQGYRNGVPAQSMAKINFRLVKNQDPQKIMELAKQHFKNILPDYVDYTYETTDPYDGVKLDINNDYVMKAESIMQDVHNKEVLFEYSGGGLPIVTYFDEIFKVPQVIANLANEDCGMHAPNENFDIDTLEKAMRFSREFFGK
jgi:acetylornithine deacetylase/succinyl-diaminopimelate desuccinylase-like protein